MTKKRSQIEIKRARILAQRRKKLQLSAFTPKQKSICGRLAEFLFWARERYPYNTITYEEITQAIFNLSRIPAKTSKHVKSVRGQMSSAGKKLNSDYHTTLVTENGVGARAAVDDADILKESVTKDVKRHHQTGEKLKKTVAQVDPSRLKKLLAHMPNSEDKQELLELAEWFNEKLSKFVRRLDQPQQKNALQLPPPSTG